MKPIVLPISDVLDLHAFQPREVADLIDDYLAACVAKGILNVRIVHGKGSGVLRERVHHLLRRHRLVAQFEAAPPGAGGWGATLVRLRPSAIPPGDPETGDNREHAITPGSPPVPAEDSIPLPEWSCPMADAKEPIHGGMEWENRRLCRDEACIGIIGPDGRCNECGLPAEDEDTDTASESAAGLVATPATDRPEDTAESRGPEVSGIRYWQERRLCPDGNCIGVIGPDGRCKECGRRADAGDL